MLQSSPLEVAVRMNMYGDYWKSRSLQSMVYGDPNTAMAESDLLQKLAESLAAFQSASTNSTQTAAIDAAREGHLGANSNALSITTTICRSAIPAGFYHLFDPQSDPLIRMVIHNPEETSRRLRITAFIEGLSAQAVRTVHIVAGGNCDIFLHPTLLPDRAKNITEVQWTTVHIVVDDLDGHQVKHDTYPLLCLARTSGYNFGLLDVATGKIDDLTHYYGAWVTPYVDDVSKMLRKAVQFHPALKITGYPAQKTGGSEVLDQVKAIFDALAAEDIVYINSVIAFGAPPGIDGQRVRLPSQTIHDKSANCLDGTVLFASLLEAASLNPGLVFVPGHAFVAWEKWPNSNEWEFLETTMIGTKDFDTASAMARLHYETFKAKTPDYVRLHSIKELRSRRIWPME